MANNCMNYITINGNIEEINELSKLLKVEGEENESSIYTNLCDHFGKQGNDARWFDIHLVDKDDNCIIIEGDSAWTPCLEIFTKISEKYQSLEIRYEYEEGGCDFAGYADINEGYCNDNCYGYWEGKTKIDYNFALESAMEDVYYDCFESEEELKSSSMYNAFQEDDQNELLEEFKKKQQN